MYGEIPRCCERICACWVKLFIVIFHVLVGDGVKLPDTEKISYRFSGEL